MKPKRVVSCLVLMSALTGCGTPTVVQQSQPPQRPAPREVAFTRPEKPLPQIGKPIMFRWGRKSDSCLRMGGGVGSLQVSTSGGRKTYFVELRQRSGPMHVASVGVAVRSGQTVTIDVPLCGLARANFDLYYSAGTKWYGYRYRFGPDGLYSQARKKFHFENGTQWGVELILRRGGNLSTSTMDYRDFIR
jgi:hypothetical protein